MNPLAKVKRRLLGDTARRWAEVAPYFSGMVGLEIGGPSGTFSRRGPLPIYPVALTVDGCNFASESVWEGTLRAGATYQYDGHKPAGHQYISEGTDLSEIADDRYDFVAASHCLEHIANPVKALAEWRRVLRPDGVIALILPDRRYTFDHRRPTTRFEHLLDDWRNEVGEDDLTHLEEILAMHDLALDPGAGDREHFETRSRRNVDNRCLHQHVFDFELLRELCAFLDLRILLEDVAEPYHQIVVASPGPTPPAR